MPYKKLRNHGLDISLAMDGVQSNNAFNILGDLKTGILIQKMEENDPTLLNAYEALKLITINAAKCLFADDMLGSLEAGKQADMIAFSAEDSNLTPVHIDHFSMVTSALVYSAGPANVTHVMVAGEMLYSNRQHLRMNPEEIKKSCKASSRRILESIDYFKHS